MPSTNHPTGPVSKGRTGLGAPARSALRAQVQQAGLRTIGGQNVLRTVQERAATSPLPGALPFGLAILSREGRIADPTAFADGWVRKGVGNEKSPWQIDPDFHQFAQHTPVDNFRAYTDYAFNLLENGFLETGSLQGAARRYNSFNACEAGRNAACERGRAYARDVMGRMAKIESILADLGIGTPNVGSFNVPGGKPSDPGVSGARGQSAGLGSGLLIAGLGASLAVGAYLFTSTLQ